MLPVSTQADNKLYEYVKNITVRISGPQSGFHSIHAIHGTTTTTTTTTTTVLQPFVRDYPGEPVPEETLTHRPS